MYHALEIQEILVAILVHCESSDLAALARTCRALKDLALDLLWEELYDLSPLARCLPEASCQTSTRPYKYSFSRSLTETEWDILQSYTHRIRSIRHFESGLGQKSFKILSKLPNCTTMSLFPNLRYLHCEYTDKTMSLLHQPFPSLISLDVQFGTPLAFQDSLLLFPMCSPNIRKIKLNINVYQLQSADYGGLDTGYVSQWRNLQSLDCAGLALNADTFVHLSRIPSLTQLTFTLGTISLDHVVSINSPLIFLNLRQLTLHSLFLDSISKLFSKIRLPAIIDFIAFIQNAPAKRDLSAFCNVVQGSGAGPTIERLRVAQTSPLPTTTHIRVPFWLELEDLRPCMTLCNLRCFDLNIGWNVGLTDDELLALGSSWPRLESLFLNVSWGWNTSGITLAGFARLLEMSPLLDHLAVVLDTRGYTGNAAQSPKNLGLRRPSFCIDVLDSVIEAEVVPAVGVFFAEVATRTSCDFCIRAWDCRVGARPQELKEYVGRWDEVRRRIGEGYSHWHWPELESDSD